ncbi:hypothetical protein J7L02_00160, partial [Candidatus Woesearchaeota archaeon]|nr:hypothetical protein [Candidatus Woesearchaeota archaeon]
MPSKEFNKELDLYLAKRKTQSQSFFEKLGIKRISFSMPKHAKYEKQESQSPETVEETIQEVIVEETTSKKPFFTKILEFFKKQEPEQEVDIELEAEEPVEQELEEQTKQLLKKLHKWLKKLPPEVKQEFKQSQDFELYKQVLK